MGIGQLGARSFSLRQHAQRVSIVASLETRNKQTWGGKEDPDPTLWQP
jgi:hypothetical protein